MRLIKRIVVMALLGSLGATLGAVGGEALFPHEERAVAPAKEICLLFDVSGSMRQRTSEGPTQLKALKRAAGEFVERMDLERNALGLVAFSSRAATLAEPGHDAAEVSKAIEFLYAGGTTDLARGLETASEALGDSDAERWILLFSDGKPEGKRHADPEGAALEAARATRAAGIEIVAIGTSLADPAFLERVTGSRDHVVVSDFASLHEAFRTSEEVIMNREMLALSSSTSDFVTTLKRAAMWSGLVALGAGLFLMIGQNRYLRRRTLGLGQLVLVIVGSAVTGLLAGSAGQGIYYGLSNVEWISGAGRMTAWILLGCGVGVGMSFFVPNLRRKRAAAAGLLGGVATAACFLTFIPDYGDTLGRLLAAAILGLCSGTMIVLVEAAFRKAWLEVTWKSGEATTLLLGPQPIVVGKSSQAHICPSWDEPGEPVMARISFQEGQVRYEDARRRERRTLRDGQTLAFGPVQVRVRALSKDAAREEGPSEPAAPMKEPARRRAA